MDCPMFGYEHDTSVDCDTAGQVRGQSGRVRVVHTRPHITKSQDIRSSYGFPSRH